MSDSPSAATARHATAARRNDLLPRRGKRAPTASEQEGVSRCVTAGKTAARAPSWLVPEWLAGRGLAAEVEAQLVHTPESGCRPLAHDPRGGRWPAP
eukprot:scaffold4384_cov367-Prasinococcus_capsulatus_cf.AAC.2